MMRRVIASMLILLGAPIHASPPSVPGADAPELAALGAYGVGFRSITFTHRGQPDVENAQADPSTVRLIDRNVLVDIWYPATAKKGSKTVLYRGSLWAEPPLPPVTFTQPGIAVAGAPVAGRKHPLVIISHGYSNNPAVNLPPERVMKAWSDMTSFLQDFIENNF